MIYHELLVVARILTLEAKWGPKSDLWLYHYKYVENVFKNVHPLVFISI